VTEEQENYLRTRYPKIFPQGTTDVYCDEGWFPIISLLCRNIQARIDWRPEIPQVTVEQIKEKFGEWRFYYDGGDDYIGGMVTMAEAVSEITCERCGDRGVLRQGGWLKTLCDEHHEERIKRKQNAD